MTTQQARLIIGVVIMMATPAVVWILYEAIGDYIGGRGGPNRYLVPLLFGAAFLIVGWLVTWWSGLAIGVRRWTTSSFALVGASMAGAGAGSAVMAVHSNPVIGMFTIFIVGGLVWIVLTTLLWSRPDQV